MVTKKGFDTLNFNTRVLLIVSLVVFLIAVTSLAANITRLRNQISSNVTSQTQIASVSQTSSSPSFVGIQAPNGNLSNPSIVLWYFVALFSMLGVVIVYVYFKDRKTKLVSQPSILAQILASLMVLVFFVLFFEAMVSGFSLPKAGPFAIQNYFFISITVGGSLLGIVLLFREFDVFHSFRKSERAEFGTGPSSNLSKQLENVQELRNIIESTVYSLDNLGDYRLAILNCYKAVISMLERNGMPQKASLTPREFEREIMSRLGVSQSKYLHNLTILFERARYSVEELSSQEAKEARYDLEKLGFELENQNTQIRVPDTPKVKLD